MYTALVRAALMCASITLAALSSGPANAELPRHHRVVTLHPLSTEHSFEEDGRPFFSGFGRAVAIRNGTAFVGIPSGVPDSRVAVYDLTASGWMRTATLKVADPLVFGRNGFGRRIVFRDGLAVIASDTFLHVFKRVNGVWTDIQKLASPQCGPGTFFAIRAMRFENGILLVASRVPSGAREVCLYEVASNGKLVQRATLRPSDSSGEFGNDVAVAGNLAVIGAKGAAFLFRRRSDGTWVQTQKLIGADTSPVESFGGAVAIDRGLIIVGAPDHECLESEEEGGGSSGFCDRGGDASHGPDGTGSGGAAYGFTSVGGQYVQVFKLRPRADEHANYVLFGRRIAMMGNYIVIDAAEQTAGGDGIFEPFSVPNGLSFTYRRDGSTVTAVGLTSGYVASDSIGLANNWLLVGSAIDNLSGCQTENQLCLGDGNIFDLNRFER
jgi:hypothetical protein